MRYKRKDEMVAALIADPFHGKVPAKIKFRPACKFRTQEAAFLSFLN